MKYFPHEVLGMPHLHISHSAKVFSANCSLLTNPQKFTSLKISHYMHLHVHVYIVLCTLCYVSLHANIGTITQLVLHVCTRI